MSEQKVAEWFVQYSSKGLELIAAELAQFGVSLGGLTTQAGKFGESMAGLNAQIAAQMKEAGASLQDLARHFGMIDATKLEVFERLRKELAGGWDMGELNRVGASLQDLAKHFGMLGAAPVDILRRLKEEYAAIDKMLASGSVEQNLQGLASLSALRGLGESKGVGSSLTGIGIAARGTAGAVAGLGQAVAPVTGQLLSWVQAGVMASGAGQILSFQFAEISRQLASLFVPQIRFLTDKLAQLIRWFQALSGEQQAQLRQWGMLLGGIAATAMILPKVIASVQALGVALQGIRAIMTGLMFSNPWLLALAAIAALVVATSDWKDLMTMVRDVTKGIEEPFKEVVKAIRQVIDGIKELRGVSKDGSGDDKDDLEKFGDWRKRHFRRSRNAAYYTTPAAALDAAGWETGARATTGLMQYGSPIAHVGALFGGLANELGLTSRFSGEAVKKLGEMATPRTDIGLPAGNFEGVEDTYRRISQASVRATGGEKTTEEKMLAEFVKTNFSVEEIKRAIEQHKNPTTK